jgi:hypothetical protein
MSASSEQGPRLHRLAYEPTTEPVTACPHCGARIDPPPAAPGAGGDGVAVVPPILGALRPRASSPCPKEGDRPLRGSEEP